jgi:branched-chain amino acid aminotransferase
MRLETPPVLFMNGKVVPWAEAQIHIWSETAVRATNVFEGLHACWQPERNTWRVIAWADHIERLACSARLMRIPHAYDEAYFADAVRNLLLALPYRQDLYVRPTIFVEYGPFTSRAEEVEVGAYIVAFPKAPSEPSPPVIKCMVSSWPRFGDLAGTPRAKSGAIYSNVRLARIEAEHKGFDDAILLNHYGRVAELTGACIFMVRGGKVVTPSVTESILEGITRAWTVKAAKRMGFDVEERPVDRTELYVSDELFGVGTLAEICAVGQVDDLTVGSGTAGEITRAISDAYADRLRARGDAPGDLLIEAARYRAAIMAR